MRRGDSKHEGGRNFRKFGKTVALAAILYGQKARKQKGVTRHARTDKGSKRRRCSRHRHDAMTGLKRELTKAITGIGDEWRSGIRHQRHGFSGLKAAMSFGPASCALCS